MLNYIAGVIGISRFSIKFFYVQYNISSISCKTKTRNIIAEKIGALYINLHKLGITLVHFKQYGNIISKLEMWRKKHIYRLVNV